MNPWWLLVVLFLLIGAAVLVVMRGSAPMAGELQLYRKEEHDGHDLDVRVISIKLYGRFRLESLDHVDPRIPDTAVRIVVMARRGLLSGVVRLCVGIRFTALKRGAMREMPVGGQLLILGLDARHVGTGQPHTPTAKLTDPI
ncbi:MAG TPA: hypothetical protein VFO16_09720 [Pseudonocardiaceae bacterium]|nr:hypothetical protein [Pseudonocardiaceae bacterium]